MSSVGPDARRFLGHRMLAKMREVCSLSGPVAYVAGNRAEPIPNQLAKASREPDHRSARSESLKKSAVDAARSLIRHIRKEVDDAQNQDEFQSLRGSKRLVVLHGSRVVKKRHKTEIHVQLLVTVE